MTPTVRSGRPARDLRSLALLALAASLALAACGPDRQADPAGATLSARLTGRPAGLPVAGDASLEAWAEALRSDVERAPAAAAITVDYPHDASVFPPEMTAPTWLWHDDSESDAWLLEFAFADGGTLAAFAPGAPMPEGEVDPEAFGATNEPYRLTPHQASARSWTPPDDLWAEIKRRTVEAPARVRVLGTRGDVPTRVLSKGTVAISTSADPVGAPIFYRDVPLMPAVAEVSGEIKPLAQQAIPLIGWRLRDVSKADSRLLLKDMPSCANCHSFSRDGRTMGMDVDGPQGDKGTYAIVDVTERIKIDYRDVITWNSFPDKPEDHKTIGFLSRVSPDGRYVASTVNEALYVANFINYRFLQVFFPTRGILAWYSRESGAMKALPGADDPKYVHCSPVWTPDGKTIVFARAEAFDPYESGRPLAREPNDPNEPRIQYSLYRIPFAEGRGGTPEPIAGASHNGMSNTFPKISPDGKWLVYTKCRNGLLMRPDGRLWIVPTEGGEAREMACNTSLMNSWHSWSPNSRWLVFSSKVNTPYTQMFLTHVDEAGNSTPPILVPNSTAANRAVNIPEFVDVEYEDFQSIEVPAVSHYRHIQSAREFLEAGKLEEAVPELRKALQVDPEAARPHLMLGTVLMDLGKPAEAREHLSRAMTLDPSSPMAYHCLGTLAGIQDRHEEAAAMFELAIARDPYFHPALLSLGMARLQLGQPEAALTRLERAQTIRPRDPAVHRYLSQAHIFLGHVAKGLEHLDHAAALDPADVRSRTLFAWYLATLPEAEHRDGQKALALAQQVCESTRYERPEPLDALAAAYAELGRFDEAIDALTRALQLIEGRNPRFEENLRQRLSLYRAGRPFRAAP